ncbi:MAG TPA: Ku protein [Planctomycetota bacterium]|nr:Ku protein [Planctomycetota bacterium]
MARGFWTGAIRFGLVNIPVSLRPAATSVDLDFDLVDSKDFAPIGYKKVNKATGEEVPADRIIKTYEVESGEAVVITDEDFARARPKDNRSLSIQAFVDLKGLSPAYYDRPYLLEPSGRDAQAYVLLRDTLAKTGKAAIAQGVLRTRERLGAIFAEGDYLLLNLLRYQHEMAARKPPEILSKADPPRPEEIKMAERLVEQMTEPWAPEKYRDTYREQLLDYIEKKAAAGEARRVYTPEEEEAPRAPGKNLMRLLKESVEGQARPEAPRRRRPRSA